MSKTAVARRAGVSLPTVHRILSGNEPRPTVHNLQAIAHALGVVVRLGETVELEEPQTVDEFRRQQANQKARHLVGLVQGTMALESQGLDEEALTDLIEKTTDDLLRSRRKLWGD